MLRSSEKIYQTYNKLKVVPDVEASQNFVRTLELFIHLTGQECQSVQNNLKY